MAAPQLVIHGAEESRSERETPLTPARAESVLTREFPNEDACLEFIKETRWPKGIVPCTKCGAARKHHRVSGRKAYACDRCGAYVYPLQGTIFARSSTSLVKWFHAIGLVTSGEPRITAKRIQRETSVTYKTAWRILHHLRATGVSESLPPRRFLELVVASSAPGERRKKRLVLSCSQSAVDGHGA